MTTTGDRTRVLFFHTYKALFSDRKVPFDLRFVNADGAKVLVDHVMAQGGIMIQRAGAHGIGNKYHSPRPPDCRSATDDVS